MTRMATGAARTAAVLSFVCGVAYAEELIVVTGDRVSLRDSTNLGTEIDGLTFALPAGFVAVGADADPDNGEFNILGRNASRDVCRVFNGGDPADAGDSLPLVASGPEVACAAGVGDLEFIRSRPGDDFGWAIGSGTDILAYQPDDPAYEVVSVTSTSGTTVDIAALGFRGVDNAVGRVISRNGSGALGDINDSDDSASTGLTLENVRALSGATLSGATSFDISETNGTMYLLTGGTIYTLSDTGVATALGAVPSGSIAVFTIPPELSSGGGGASGSDDDEEDEGSGDIKVGAFGGLLLLPLGLLAALKRLRSARGRSAIRN